MSDLVSPGFVKDALNVDWVEVPGGVLIRGTPADVVDDVVRRHADYALPRSYFAKEVPRSEVRVTPSSIFCTPVSLGKWRLFQDELCARLRGSGPPSCRRSSRLVAPCPCSMVHQSPPLLVRRHVPDRKTGGGGECGVGSS